MKTRVPVDEKLLLKDFEAAELLSVSVVTLMKLPIPRVRLPEANAVRFKRSDLDEYVKRLAA